MAKKAQRRRPPSRPRPAELAEERRMAEDAAKERYWRRFGPYLAERQWGTVREDYSADGNVWRYFTHEQARSRAYRWGEDGLLGICDAKGRLCFALALWNGRDPFLKERLFGLAGPEGNHGEDAKELWFYQDSTPTHSYLRALYKYPLAEFPYARLVEENGRRGTADPELELEDLGVLDGGRYVDVTAEYAKASPEDVCVRVTLENRADEEAELAVLPTVWFRNTWSWGRTGEEYGARPSLERAEPPRGAAAAIAASHAVLGGYRVLAGPGPDGAVPELLFTENETNAQRLFGAANPAPFVKDAFHDYVVGGRRDAVNPEGAGTKAAFLYRVRLAPRGRAELMLRLVADGERPGAAPLGAALRRVFEDRRREADEFFDARIPSGLDEQERAVARQAYAGLLWSKQFYLYIVRHWLEGDPGQPAPPTERVRGRNVEWLQLYNRDVVSMPDKWEYPWYAAWDLAFHTIPLAEIDPGFAKKQLVLFLREWYMHPSGQLPAYEFQLGDVNPPVHAWACWRVYKMTGPRGARDRAFLARTFQKLVINFTWWVNKKDERGNNLFGGGFLGLDNIGVFDRSRPLPGGGILEQADGTAWMAFYCATMLSIALELARGDKAYGDMASKFFEHYVAIADAMNGAQGAGLWDERDGFYYDRLLRGAEDVPLRVRSLVGLVPLFATEIIEEETLRALPGFRRRFEWFLEHNAELARCVEHSPEGGGRYLLSIPSRDRLERVLAYLFDEREFLSPYGVRSLSRVHEEKPFVLRDGGEEYRVDYAPGESRTSMFGGNSNWRGPVWLPMNYLVVEALERYHHFHGDDLTVELPAGSGRRVDLREAAGELSTRVARLFVRDGGGRRPCLGDDARWRDDPHFREHVLFHEYFHAETGKGLGASHQTGWTALAVRFLEDRAERREAARRPARRPR